MLSARISWLKRARRGNVAVEFALVMALFVLPLLLGAADFVPIIAAQAQLNTALEALYYYAVTAQGSSSADTAAILSAINSNSTFRLTLSSQSITYSCYTTPASADTTPSISTPTSTDCSAAGKTTMTYANYTLTTSVALPVPIPGLANPLPVSASGAVQIATANTPAS